MKKLLSLTLLSALMLGGWASARNIYDSTGRNLIYDGTLRGQKRAAAQKVEQQRKIQAAAAAKLDYEQALKELEKPVVRKSNYIQSKNVKEVPAVNTNTVEDKAETASSSAE